MTVHEVRVPDIGDFADVPVIEVLVAAGDEVAAEDPLVTLESDKATMDVPAPLPGVVGELRVKVGERVSEGSVLMTIEPSQAANGDRSGPDQDAPATQAGVVDEPPPSLDGGDRDAQLIVLGAGVGGYTAAFRAADLGLRTILVERDERLGGVCLNVGCIPSKALLHAARVIAETREMATRGVSFGAPQVDLEALVGWKRGVVERLTGGLALLAKQRKIEVARGEARLTGPHSMRVGDREISFEHCVIAAGSEPARLPFIPEDPRVIDSTGALSPDAIPQRMLVIGGGIIGLEMATVYDALGARVTVVEMLDQLLPGCDPDLVKPLKERVTQRYEQVLTGTEVTSVKPQKNGLKVDLSGDAKPQMFDCILVAVGRVPNGRTIGAQDAGVEVDERGFIPVDSHLRTNVPNIYAIGDIVGGPMLAHKASHEGKTAAEVIAGVPGAQFDVRTIPSVAFTDPEVAWMGLTETEAKARGVEYDKQSFPWSASGRALGLARPEGITKLLFEPATRRLLGAGIVGVGAGDLIAETVLALELGADAEDIALSVHPHPTLSETIAFAAELESGSITDLMPPRRRR